MSELDEWLNNSSGGGWSNSDEIRLDGPNGSYIWITFRTGQNQPFIELMPPEHPNIPDLTPAGIQASNTTNGTILALVSPGSESAPGQNGFMWLFYEPGGLFSNIPYWDYGAWIPRIIVSDMANDWSGKMYGRGLIGEATRTTNLAGIIAETTTLVAADCEFKANRAYRVQIEARYVLAAAAIQIPLPRIRKDVLAGQSLVDFARFHLPASMSTFGQATTGVFVCGNADVTCDILMTLEVPAAPSITIGGAANAPSRMTIIDIGEASDYPDGVALV